MILAISIVVAAVFVVIVLIIILMCIETETPQSIDIQYEKQKRKSLKLPEPPENCENFIMNEDEISANADYHVIKENTKKPYELFETPDNIDNVGFRVNRNKLKEVILSESGYSD